MSKEDPIQAQLIAARRQQILQAAVQAFSEKGFHRATIKDIAKIARIADGTIYIYFGNKQEILLAILDLINESESRAEDFARSETMDLREYMQMYIRERLNTLSSAGLAILRVLFSEVLINEELRELYFQRTLLPTMQLGERYFQQWIDEGKLQTQDAATAMRLVASTFLGVVMMRLVGDPFMESNWEQISEYTTEFVLSGLEVKNDSSTND